MSPLTILQFDDALVSSPDGNPPNSVAGQGAARGAGEGDAGLAGGDGTRRGLGRDARRGSTRCRRRERTLDNPEWVKFLLYDNEGEIRKALRSVFLERRHRADRRAAARQRVDRGRGRGVGSRASAKRRAALRRTRARSPTGAAGAAQGHQRLPHAAACSRSAPSPSPIMVVILLVLFDVRWRLLPLAVVLVGVDLGVRARRLPRHPADDRHHRRASR